ncbi:KAP family P-loop NTPase fold protein [Microbacterium sp. A84]|uniref:KAP family P-loop NTPase fold protein n=1 Tax=Microbacterium sp. A84 TaxID=3450715 RepID=UPI003F434855
MSSGDKKAKNGSDDTRGVIDTPLGEDWLSIQPYVEGLSGFIGGCQTPMTIAVQGDWGTGKTNMMLLAERQLAPHGHFRLSDPPKNAPEATEEAPVYTIRFNTWQYSQFEMQGRLVGSLLENIGAHLLLAEPGKKGAEKRKEFLNALLPIASTAGLSVLQTGLGFVGLGALSGVVQEVSAEARVALAKRNGGAPVEDVAAVLVDVKAKFAAAVKELVTADGDADTGRLVVFIDDLDRLEPRKAVELMESLKLFLDVPHCVFVLAIDFSVVQQGVIDKYGSRMGRAKARSFFDKIIQVPFQMPVGAYRLEVFLDELIKETRLVLSDDERSSFLGLIQYSVGSNPRSIKRLINTFMLLRGISTIGRQQSDERGATGQSTDLQLFAILCLQTAYPDAYLELVSGDVEESSIFQRFFVASEGNSTEADEVQNSADAEKLLVEAGIEAGGKRFGQLASEIMSQFKNRDGFDVGAFESVLRQAITTSSGADSTPSTSRRGPKVYGADARQQRIAQKAPWAARPGALALPEQFCTRLEDSSEQVRIGVPESDTQGWVIEVARKRVGMLHVRQKFVHVSLEPRWFKEKNPKFFYEKFRKQFAGDADLLERVDVNDYGGFIINRIKPTEAELLGRLADFWVDVIQEDLDKP